MKEESAFHLGREVKNPGKVWSNFWKNLLHRYADEHPHLFEGDAEIIKVKKEMKIVNGDRTTYEKAKSKY